MRISRERLEIGARFQVLYPQSRWSPIQGSYLHNFRNDLWPSFLRRSRSRQLKMRISRERLEIGARFQVLYPQSRGSPIQWSNLHNWQNNLWPSFLRRSRSRQLKMWISRQRLEIDARFQVLYLVFSRVKVTVAKNANISRTVKDRRAISSVMPTKSRVADLMEQFAYLAEWPLT